MITPAHIETWAERQRRLLHDTYQQAWEDGVAGYEPDDDPEDPEPSYQHAVAKAGASIGSLLIARRLMRYEAPTEPDDTARNLALSRALASVDAMIAELATLTPTREQTDRARDILDATDASDQAIGEVASSIALSDWAEANAYRLDGGESVAWAGEQDGYGQAADADGMLLSWQTEDDERVCDDCSDLGDLPPMPLADFPTTPGAGDTDCNVGCRCSLEATEELAPGDQLFGLTPDADAVLGRIAQSRAEQLAVI